MPHLARTTVQLILASLFAAQATAQGVELVPYVLLGGPLDTATMQMSTDLLDSSLLPLAEPYTALGYPAINGGGETVDSAGMHGAYFGGGGKTTDWVRVELRSATDATNVVAVHNALVRRDGSIYNQTVTQSSVCGPGTALAVPADTVTDDPIVSPFSCTYHRSRHQYLFLASELDPTRQSGMTTGQGLCPGEPIDSIGFQLINSDQRLSFWSITVKHANFNSLSTFDNNIDPAAGCASNSVPMVMPPITTGTVWFYLNTPFVWDGVRNVVIDCCFATAGAGVFSNATVQATSGLNFNASYALYTNSAAGTCNSAGGCSGTTPGCGITSAPGCPGASGGPSTIRPVVHWGGVVAGAPVVEAGLVPLEFNVPADEYYVAVRHRNHLGCMTAQPMQLDTIETYIDFSDTALLTYGQEGRKFINGKAALWAGNTTNNGDLRYLGLGNDRDPILLRIGGSLPTNVVNGYFVEDVDLNGQVKYTGLGNDRDPILVNIGGSVPTNVRAEQLP